MNFVHTKKADLKTGKWAGGTTTQLAIFPETAQYQQFNFQFRISYATVQVPESTFTFMPGVTRHLLILAGDLEIEHENKYKKKLHKFDIDIFNGEWATKAKGKVTDFNLMTTGGTSGSLEAQYVQTNTIYSILPNPRINYTGIYLYKGDMQLKTSEQNIQLESGDFILITQPITTSLQVEGVTNSELIISRIKSGGVN